MVAGAFGRELMAVSAELILIFIMAAHILSFSICLNALTGHAVCTVVFGFAGFAVCLVLTLPRTYKNIAYFSFFCESAALRVRRWWGCADSGCQRVSPS